MLEFYQHDVFDAHQSLGFEMIEWVFYSHIIIKILSSKQFTLSI